MKSKIYFTIMSLFLLLIGCREDIVNPLNDKGSLFVNSTPDAAEIWIDGESTKKFTPAKIELTTGKHYITLRKEGYVSKTFTVDIKNNQESELEIKNLIRLGGYSIYSEPSFADIDINGIGQGVSTPDNFDLDEGTYQITLRAESFFDTTFTISITNNNDLSDFIKLRSKNIKSFTAIIWDSSSTDGNKLGGLDLSTGENLVLSEGQSKGVDLFYSAKNSIIGSPRKVNGLNRNTMFIDGSSDYLDRINAPEEVDDAWSDSTFANKENYLFVFDANGHHSKLQIIEKVGGTPEDTLSGIKVKWLYNTKAYDNFF